MSVTGKPHIWEAENSKCLFLLDKWPARLINNTNKLLVLCWCTNCFSNKRKTRKLFFSIVLGRALLSLVNGVEKEIKEAIVINIYYICADLQPIRGSDPHQIRTTPCQTWHLHSAAHWFIPPPNANITATGWAATTRRVSVWRREGVTWPHSATRHMFRWESRKEQKRQRRVGVKGKGTEEIWRMAWGGGAWFKIEKSERWWPTSSALHLPLRIHPNTNRKY